MGEASLRPVPRLLPVTMVGSYPRPRWFRHQLHGRDLLEAFKDFEHTEAFHDATRSAIQDQVQAGLDIVTDGQMWFDDYHMGIGAFFWYWFERIGGLGKEKLPHPQRKIARGIDAFIMDEAGAVAVRGELTRGPLRLRQLYELAQAETDRPIKACVGAGAVQLSTLAHFESGPVKNRYDLAAALAEIFNAEMRELSAAGCRYIQLEDLGAWIPNLSGDKDFAWVARTVNRMLEGVPARKSWHFCMGNAWGNRLDAMTRGGYAAILPRYLDVDCDEFVLDFACREMQDAVLLKDLPPDKSVAVGVIDVRSLEVEQPEQVAERVRKVLEFIGPERVTLTTDCGMKQLPRPVALRKLRSLAAGAALVRQELGGAAS
jgi:5-methyltetrahydropteroyltriglutamate--homocysteine methyltransferase